MYKTLCFKMKLYKFNQLNKFESKVELMPDFDELSKKLNEITEKIKKYYGDCRLIDDLISLKEKNYQSMRPWKLKLIEKQYETISSLIDTAILIEDYLIEIEDKGYNLEINSKYKRIFIVMVVDNSNFFEEMQFLSSQILSLKKRINVDFITMGRTGESNYKFELSWS